MAAGGGKSFPFHRIALVIIHEVMSSWIPAAASLLVNNKLTLGSLYVKKNYTERGLSLAKVIVWYPIPYPAWWIVWLVPLKAVPLDCFAREQKCNTRLSKQFDRPSSALEIDRLWLRIYDSYHSVCHVTGGMESRCWISGFWSLAYAPTIFVRKPVSEVPMVMWCLSYYLCWGLHYLTLTPQAWEETKWPKYFSVTFFFLFSTSPVSANGFTL